MPRTVAGPLHGAQQIARRMLEREVEIVGNHGVARHLVDERVPDLFWV